MTAARKLDHDTEMLDRELEDLGSVAKFPPV